MRFAIAVLLLTVPFVSAEEPKIATDLLDRGHEWMRKKEYDKAIKNYDEAIRLDPTNALAFNARGNAFTMKGEHNKAVRNFDEAIRLSPKDAIFFNNRADAWFKMKHWDDAIKDYTEAIRLIPSKDVISSSYFHSARAIAWKHNKNYIKAIKDCDEAARIDPKDDYALAIRASVHAKFGKYLEALADFDKAMTIRAEPIRWVHLEFAIFLATCPDAKYRDGPKALKLANAAIEKAGKNANWEYHSALAAALAETGDFDGAVKEQKAALADKAMHADDKKDQEARLKLYEAKKPFRDE